MKSYFFNETLNHRLLINTFSTYRPINHPIKDTEESTSFCSKLEFALLQMKDAMGLEQMKKPFFLCDIRSIL